MHSLDWVMHNSHLPSFRQPFGAAECGQAIQLSLAVRSDRIDQVSAVALRLWREEAGESILSMALHSKDQDWVWFLTEHNAPDEPGLIWYYFVISLSNGETIYYGNNEMNLGGEGRLRSGQPDSYQITVVPGEAKTPDWWKRSIIYQIFPDRFANGRPDKSVLSPRKGSLLHAHWDDDPVYVKDESGRVLAYDFFGGNLAGVRLKLPYLKDLGVSVIYFNPLFASPSNHKYDTGDYLQIDQMFGSNQEFREFCAAAREAGIAVLLDGVFSHTGSDSRYFNREGSYPELGAYQSQESPYFSWYRFNQHPDSYDCWWGVDALPNVNEMEPSYRNFIIGGENSVLKYWLKHGIKGWRLDVADELPDEFIKEFRSVLKQQDPEAILLGEVWEDASRKVSYGKMRQYLWGEELDSVMNYPFRQVVLDFLLYRSDAASVHQSLMCLYENYPKQSFFSTMNLIGSHDSPRALTLLGESPPEESLNGVGERSKYRLSPPQRSLAAARLKLAVLWQMTFPGVPSIYYGDEAGLEGYSDPLNRRTYPWGKADSSLIAWYRQLARLRRDYQLLQTGEWQSMPVTSDVYGYLRIIRGGSDVFGQPAEDNTAIVLLNRSENSVSVKLDVPELAAEMADMLCGEQVLSFSKTKAIDLAPYEGKLLLSHPHKRKRGAGILLHPTCLPGKFGIGDMGPEAYAFIDWLAEAKQQYWQILPLCPPGLGDSPYQSPSAFAGSHLLISPEMLVTDGLISADEAANEMLPVNEKADFAAARHAKQKLFRLAFSRFTADDSFREFSRTQPWLDDYALFMALSEKYFPSQWIDWPESVAKRNPAELEKLRQELSDEITYIKFLQYLFFRQWTMLRLYANQRGIRIIGDLPLFVAHHSADVWANPEYFSLDESGRPSRIAGVPPDYFSATGQLWGNPQYDWESLKRDDYKWWIERLKVLFTQVDIVRIDHFRGLAAYWEVLAEAKTAIDGKWQTGPGADFLLACFQELPKADFIAEDLGIITPDVDELRWRFALPGMQVLQFAFGGDGLPPDQTHMVVYTGTHDNNTTIGWLNELRDIDSGFYSRVLSQIGANESMDDEQIAEVFVRFAFGRRADRVIVPMQDILALDSNARMNTPGTPAGNWNWRLSKACLTENVARKLAQWVEAAGRS